MNRFLRRLLRRRRDTRPKPPTVPTSHLVNAGLGKPSRCVFCDDRAAFVIMGKGSQAFTCSEHLGPFVADWTVERDLRVIRL